MDLLLHKSPAALAAAQKCVSSGTVQVGPSRVPVSWSPARQPADTVRVVFAEPPLGLANWGFIGTVLAAAGYDYSVVHEQLGHNSLLGDAVAVRVPNANYIVAYVAAPEDDLVLINLPDAFEVAGRPGKSCTISVDGRTAQQPQKWQQEQVALLTCRQRGRPAAGTHSATAAAAAAGAAEGAGATTTATTATIAAATATGSRNTRGA